MFICAQHESIYFQSFLPLFIFFQSHFFFIILMSVSQMSPRSTIFPRFSKVWALRAVVIFYFKFTFLYNLHLPINCKPFFDYMTKYLKVQKASFLVDEVLFFVVFSVVIRDC